MTPCPFPTTITITPRAPTMVDRPWNQAKPIIYTNLDNAQFGCKPVLYMHSILHLCVWCWYIKYIYQLYTHKNTHIYTRRNMHVHTHLGSSVLSNDTDMNTRISKAWTTIDSLLIIWKSHLTDKMQRSFSEQRSCRNSCMDALHGR